jgi:hypothetical protein
MALSHSKTTASQDLAQPEASPGADQQTGRPPAARRGNAWAAERLKARASPAIQEDTASQLDPGASLPFQSELEQAFGTSLGHVQASQGPATACALEGMAARAAFEDGTVLLGPNPSREEVAHEVVHALQEDQFGSAAGGGVSSQGDAAEAEAADVSKKALAGQPFDITQKPSAAVSRWGLGSMLSSAASAVSAAASVFSSTVDVGSDASDSVASSVSSPAPSPALTTTAPMPSSVGAPASTTAPAQNPDWSNAATGPNPALAFVPTLTTLSGALSPAGFAHAGTGVSQVAGDFAAYVQEPETIAMAIDLGEDVSPISQVTLGWLQDRYGEKVDTLTAPLNEAVRKVSWKASEFVEESTGWLASASTRTADWLAGGLDTASKWMSGSVDAVTDLVVGGVSLVAGSESTTVKVVRGIAALTDGAASIGLQMLSNSIGGETEAVGDWMSSRISAFGDKLSTKIDNAGDFFNLGVRKVRDFFGLDEFPSKFTGHTEIPDNAGEHIQQYSEVGLPLTDEAWAMQEAIDGGKLRDSYDTSVLAYLEEVGTLDSALARGGWQPGDLPGDFCSLDDTSLQDMMAAVDEAYGGTHSLLNSLPQADRIALQDRIVQDYLEAANENSEATVILEMLPTDTSQKGREGMESLFEWFVEGSAPNDFRVNSDVADARESALGFADLVTGEEAAGDDTNDVYSLVVPYSNTVSNVLGRDGVPTDGADNLDTYLAWLDEHVQTVAIGYSQGGAAVIEHAMSSRDGKLDLAVSLAPMGGADQQGGTGVWGGQQGETQMMTIVHDDDPAVAVDGSGDREQLVEGTMDFPASENLFLHSDTLDDYMCLQDGASYADRGTIGYPAEDVRLWLEQLLNSDFEGEEYKQLDGWDKDLRS